MSKIHVKKISVKRGTSLWGVHPVLLRAAHGFMEIVFEVAGVRCMITSGWDATHGKGSLHDFGHALDFRSSEIATDEAKSIILSRLRARFPSPEYDVLFEDAGGSNEHFHIEKNATAQEKAEYLKRVFGGVA